MNKWACEIERVDNGFVVKNISEGCDEEFDIKVFEDDLETDNEFDEHAESLLSLFYCLKEFFAVYNSKYNKRQFRMFLANTDECCEDCKEEIDYLRKENDSQMEEIQNLRSDYQKLLKNLSLPPDGKLANHIQNPNIEKDKFKERGFYEKEVEWKE